MSRRLSTKRVSSSWPKPVMPSGQSPASIGEGRYADSGTIELLTVRLGFRSVRGGRTNGNVGLHTLIAVDPELRLKWSLPGILNDLGFSPAWEKAAKRLHQTEYF